MQFVPPPNVTVKRDEGIELEWEDGMVAQFDLVTVRNQCPCAECRALRAKDEDVWPRPHSPLPLRIDDAELSGSFGVSLRWNDGHGTGIFDFVAFRRWAEQGYTDPPPVG